jgi:hypothetical protein
MPSRWPGAPRRSRRRAPTPELLALASFSARPTCCRQLRIHPIVRNGSGRLPAALRRAGGALATISSRRALADGPPKRRARDHPRRVDEPKRSWNVLDMGARRPPMIDRRRRMICCLPVTPRPRSTSGSPFLDSRQRHGLAVVGREVVHDEAAVFGIELGHGLLFDHPVQELVPSLTREPLLGNTIRTIHAVCCSSEPPAAWLVQPVDRRYSLTRRYPGRVCLMPRALTGLCLLAT